MDFRVSNVSTYEAPTEFTALAAATAAGEAAGRLDPRGTVYVGGLELTSGGNFTQALKDNLKEHSLYKNIVKDAIQTYVVQTVGWFGLNILLYGGTMLYDGFGTERKKRTAELPADYFGGVKRTLDESQVNRF